MQLAGALGQAKKSGNLATIEKAQKEHDEYRDLCLQSDEMTTGMSVGELYYGKPGERQS